jgi:RNA-directed DNA polymerase
MKKKTGKTRTIHNPDAQMRRAQWRICSNILNQVPIPEYIWGFERGKSVPKMAEVHRGKNVVISLDIKDFFPSIKQVDVKRIFEALGVSHGPSAQILSELCTYKAFVPQGALTSPKLSNIMVAATFGPLVKRFCDIYKLNLSIYADDVTISFDGVPEVVDNQTDMSQRDFVKKTINFVRISLGEYHFRLNPDKIKVMRRHNRQWVCGAVVNDRVNMMKRDRSNLRALVHNCELHGIEAEAGKTGSKTLAFIQKFGGKLNWYRQLNPEKGGPLYTRFKKLSIPLTKQYPGFDLDKIVYDSGIENPETREQMEATK